LTKALNNTTSYPLWTSLHLHLIILRIFGFIAYFHILDEKSKKVDDKTTKYIFISYAKSIGVDAYRLYVSVSSRIFFNRNSHFFKDDILQSRF
jgi:hypothetical protein